MDSREAQKARRAYVGSRWGVLLIKALVTSVLFGIIIYHVDIFETLRKINMLGAGAALFILFVLCVQQLIGALRWLLILQSLGQTIGPLRSVQIFFASNVAGLVLVTTLGGLSVRGYLLYRAGASWARAVLSIGLERLFAISALALCSVVGVAVFGRYRGWEPLIVFGPVGLVPFLIALIVAAIALVVVLRIQKRWASELLELVKRLITHPSASLAIFLLSILMLMLGFGTVALISIFLDLKVSIVLLLSVQPIVAIMAALPVSLGGWGVRESAMIVGLGLVGVSSADALTISVIYGALGILSVLATAGATRIFSLNRERPPIGPAAHLRRRSASTELHKRSMPHDSEMTQTCLSERMTP